MLMVGENGVPETPDWRLPPRDTADEPLDMPRCWLGEN